MSFLTSFFLLQIARKQRRAERRKCKNARN